MPNPGSFTGSRGEFLKDERERYAQAVSDGNINDVVSDIQRRYFKRYPITLAHDEEPSQEWLDQVDDDAPDPEIEPPVVDGMSPEDASKALEEHANLIKKLKDRKDSIRRRLHYVYSKEKDPRSSTKSGFATDIVSALTSRIVGVDAKIPRQKTAYNVWGPQHCELVDPVFNKRVEENSIPASQHIALRSSIYKDLFSKLPQDEQDLWAKAAIREHEKTIREIKKNLEKGASTTPQDRQRVITALPSIIEPIFDLLAKYTGWKFSVIAGGPEPADGGRLNLIMVHSGVIPGTVKADFGRNQHEVFKKHITPSFGSFLKKCYTIDECRSRALPQGFDIRSLADVKADEPLDLHSFDIDGEHVDASKSHKAKRLFEKEVKTWKSKKADSDIVPQIGNPPSLRSGPPLGKAKKLRELPTKDKPKDIFLQGFSFGDLGDVPDKRVLTSDEASSLYGAVAAALQCYVSTAARTNPPTPAPSRDPFSIKSHEADAANSQLPQHQHAQASPVVTPLSLPPSPAASRPASPLATLGENEGSSVTPPSLAAEPSTPSDALLPCPTVTVSPIRLTTPSPPQHYVAPLLRSSTSPTHRPSSARSTPALRCPSSTPSPVRREKMDKAAAEPQHTQRRVTPSGAVTVPELPAVDEGPTDRTRGTRTVSAGSEKRRALSPKGDAPKKKQRMSVGTLFEPAFPLDLPPDCPQWVQSALDLLTREDLGATWRDLVLAWLSFKEKSMFVQEGQRLSSQGRPQCVADWVKRARSPRYAPNLGDLRLYEATFVKWWNSMQPEWRDAGEAIEVGGGRGGDDWGSLDECHGLNGILSAVAALFFWGSTAANGELTGWNTAVADVLYVLQQLT